MGSFCGLSCLACKRMHSNSSSSQSQSEQWGPVSCSLGLWWRAAFAVKRWIFYFLCLVSWLENLGGAVVLFTCFS